MIEEKYLTEKKVNLQKDSFEKVVKDLFLNYTYDEYPKKAKAMTIDTVKNEAEKIINAWLKKALTKI